MNLEQTDLLTAVLALQGDEKIFVRITENESKQLRFVYFRKSGLENTVLSYINATSELANEVNFEKLVDKIAALTLEEQSVKEGILANNLPKDLVDYLLSPVTKHSYMIDTRNNVFILSNADSSNDQLHSCERHIPGQEHVHNENCAVHDHDHGDGHAGHGHHNHNHDHKH